MADGPNSELVRSALLAQNREDDDAFVAALADDIEWNAGSSAFGFPERLHGRDEVLAAAHEARRRNGGLTATLHEVHEDGDDVLVVGSLSGRSIRMPRSWIWTIRDGKAVSVRAFGSRDAALGVWLQDHPPPR